MTGFRPRPWPTVIALALFAITAGLGVWQLQRLTWKTALLATLAARMNGAPVDLPAAIDDPAGWAFRNVTVAGRFAEIAPFHLYGRTYDGKAGVHLLIPLIRDDGSAVLVDRGFVPFDHASTLADYRPAPGRATVAGIVRAPEPAGWFLPAASPAENIWYAVDIAAMAAAAHLSLAPVYVAARPSGAPGWPAATGGTEATGIRNEHLNYAIFWFGMAGVLIVVYVLSSRPRGR